jgi:type I restriction enzyme S subunit
MSEWRKTTLGSLGGDYIRGNGISRADIYDSGIPCVRYGEIYTTYEIAFEQANSYTSEDVARKCKHIKYGDILFTLSGETADEIGKNTVFLGDEDTVVGGDLGVLTNHKQEPLFLSYILSLPEVQKQKSLLSTGTIIVHINCSKLAELKIMLPELPEQRKIAEVLVTMDDAIDKTRALIEKYTNVKTGMMQDLLTNGFDCLLGDAVDRFQYGLNAAAKPYDGENKYIRITDIDEKSHQFSKADLTSPNGVLADEYLLKENDLLFARTGASTGKTYLYSLEDGKVYFAGFLIRGNVKKSYDPRYIFYQTQTDKYKTWVNIMSLRSGQPGINANEYAKYPFKCPSKPEQERIADAIETADKKIKTERDYLAKLQNIKRGLMHDLLENIVSVEPLMH